MEFDPQATICPLCSGQIFLWASKTYLGETFQYSRCQTCDFCFVNPRPTIAALDQFYSDPSRHSPEPTAPRPGSKNVDTWPTRSIELLRKFYPAGKTFLDVGAGFGQFTYAALQAGLIPTALEIGKAEIAALQAAPGVKVENVLFEQFQSDANQFDFVFMSHVLEHAHDPKEWIEKAANILAPRGVLAVMLPHFNSMYRLLGGTRDPYFYPPEHLNHFNRRSLSQLCAANGLKSVHAHSEGRLPSDVITRRLRLPRPAVPVVRGLTAAASWSLELVQRATHTGGVLILFAQKPA